MVQSVDSAIREIQESGECVVGDDMLLDMISRRLDESDIAHEVLKGVDGWIIQQTDG